jgi:plastocyanin domain-containing protein
MKNLGQTYKAILIFGAVLICLILPVASSGQTKRKKNVATKTQVVSVNITRTGYEPGSLNLKRGVPARIVFTRRTDATCAKEVVIPDYGINRPLPLNEAVVVTLTPRKTGKFTFTCGMNMMRGKIVVR